ncbi:hypothetical protein HanIR_Chr16g0830911 [Helianthus annuus]|nr:hypothetical protein HanIR_Chr16g0830911 [Helianthus annuus]
MEVGNYPNNRMGVSLHTHHFESVPRQRTKGTRLLIEWTIFDAPLQDSISTTYPRDVSFHEETQLFTRTRRKL